MEITVLVSNYSLSNFVGKRSAANVLAGWERSKQDYWRRTANLDGCCGVCFSFITWWQFVVDVGHRHEYEYSRRYFTKCRINVVQLKVCAIKPRDHILCLHLQDLHLLSVCYGMQYKLCRQTETVHNGAPPALNVFCNWCFFTLEFLSGVARNIAV